MKKTSIILSSVLYIISFSASFAYSPKDVSNTGFLVNHGIIEHQYRKEFYRLDDKITRAEVIGMALKLKGITLPDNYTCKNYFTDVKYNTQNNWICRAVEIAADEGLISRNNTKFRPADTITRVEALAIVMEGGGVEDISAAENKDRVADDGYAFFYEARDWQKGVMSKAYYRYIIEDVSRNYACNRSATRAEVFGFIGNILGWVVNSETRVVGNDPSLFVRQLMETPGPAEQFIPKNETSRIFLQQNFHGTEFEKETNFLALSFFVLDEVKIEDYFYYGGLSSSKSDLRIVRNMIYARHGRQFESKDLQEFFNSQSWYTIDPNYSDALLTEIDLKNISFIQKQESGLKA